MAPPAAGTCSRRGPPPRRCDTRDGCGVAFLSSDRLVTGCADGLVRFWRLPAPVTGSVEQIKAWAEVLTGGELDDNGVTQVLTADAWQARRRTLEQLGGPP